jgi:hypothetical protein
MCAKQVTKRLFLHQFTAKEIVLRLNSFSIVLVDLIFLRKIFADLAKFIIIRIRMRVSLQQFLLSYCQFCYKTVLKFTLYLPEYATRVPSNLDTNSSGELISATSFIVRTIDLGSNMYSFIYGLTKYSPG